MTNRLYNYSIEDPKLHTALSLTSIDVLYCDPPWGDGHMKLFATMMEKQTGTRPDQISFQALLDALVKLALTGPGPQGRTFIEIGPRWTDTVASALDERLPNVRVHNGFVYGSGNRPLSVISAGAPWAKPDGIGLKGYGMVKDIVKSVAKPGGVLLDPCCGHGYSAAAALEAGMSFIGNEFNPVRLERTRTLIRRMGENIA